MTDVVQGADIRVVEGGYCSCFAFEALPGILVC
jgi:hypothetical protein